MWVSVLAVFKNNSLQWLSQFVTLWTKALKRLFFYFLLKAEQKENGFRGSEKATEALKP